MNDPFLRLFGYRKGELEGSNVARIMPNPFSAQHDSEGRGGAGWAWLAGAVQCVGLAPSAWAG